MRNLTAVAAVLIVLHAPLRGQINSFPFSEGFDALTPPGLPAGWESSQNRSPGTDDFTSTASTPFSPPNALISTNATVEQTLVSPAFGFSGTVPDSLSFHTRRSSTHLAAVVLEASFDGGATFALRLGDTLISSGATAYERTSIVLPETLSLVPEVLFRWRVVPGKTGTTGTFRLDDLLVTAKQGVDLALTAITPSPLFPDPGGPFLLTLQSRNVGAESVPGYDASVFLDANNDSVAQSAELLGSVPGSVPVPPGDSRDVAIPMGPLEAGTHSIIGVVTAPDDGNRSNDTLTIALQVGSPPRPIVINEIMYAPSGPEPEWIELFNTWPEEVDITNWQIADRTSAVVVTAGFLLVPPLSFLVLTDDPDALALVHPGLPSPVVAVPSLPSLNNTGDAVFLFDAQGVVIDSVSYEPKWGGSGGVSLERVDPFEPDSGPSNWKSSIDTSGSTPGKPNSVMILEDDLKILRIDDTTAASFNPLILKVLVGNTGKNISGEFSAALYHDVDQDSIPEAFELVAGPEVGGPLAPGDSVVIALTWTDPRPGWHTALVELLYAEDMRPSDNRLLVPVFSGFAGGSLVINEIMFAPFPGGSEYVELHNPGEAEVDLSGWVVSDRPGTDGMANEIDIPAGGYTVEPGEFFVLADDSSIFSSFPFLHAPGQERILISGGGMSLNNEGDDILLRDPGGNMIDSVSYAPSWHLPGVADQTGRSLERIHFSLRANDPLSWSTCAKVEGGTPGTANSVLAADLPRSHALSFRPNPFSPDQDGYQDATVIHYEITKAPALVSVRVYDVRGRLIRVLATREPSGSTGNLVWNGYDDDGRKARIGMYVILLEAMSEGGAVLGAAKGVVVLAAKL
jgi:hypothetical protein